MRVVYGHGYATRSDSRLPRRSAVTEAEFSSRRSILGSVMHFADDGQRTLAHFVIDPSQVFAEHAQA